MLWLKHGDKILFRTKQQHAFAPGTWNSICVPAKICDEFGYFVSGKITFEGEVCDPTLPGTFEGFPAFCLISPADYRRLNGPRT